MGTGPGFFPIFFFLFGKVPPWQRHTCAHWPQWNARLNPNPLPLVIPAHRRGGAQEIWIPKTFGGLQGAAHALRGELHKGWVRNEGYIGLPSGNPTEYGTMNWVSELVWYDWNWNFSTQSQWPQAGRCAWQVSEGLPQIASHTQRVRAVHHGSHRSGEGLSQRLAAGTAGASAVRSGELHPAVAQHPAGGGPVWRPHGRQVQGDPEAHWHCDREHQSDRGVRRVHREIQVRFPSLVFSWYAI